eukprot:2123640-Pleurochrysis_carterae.AAC.1
MRSSLSLPAARNTHRRPTAGRLCSGKGDWATATGTVAASNPTIALILGNAVVVSTAAAGAAGPVMLVLQTPSTAGAAVEHRCT